MTDWRAAGQLADAHRVVTLARGEYGSPSKRHARETAVRFLSANSTGTVLDLWGGGTSADALTAAGLDVLSVEDGRWMKAGLGISRVRCTRSLLISGQEGGYRTAWGRATKYAPDCASAFYDFCGHWCSDVRRTLRASQHMTTIVITLMPERVAVGHGLTPHEWAAVYRALIRQSLPNHIFGLFRRYRRPTGQWVFLFGMKFSPERTERLNHARAAKRRAAPRRSTPEQRARRNEIARELYRNSPEAQQREREKYLKRMTDPCKVAQRKATNAARRARMRQAVALSHPSRPD